MVDVINYGATGDGTTDDSAAFTAALATGKAVYVPAGTYAINSVTLTSGDVIIGASRADVLLKVNANDAGAFTWANGERIRLSNMGCTAAAGVTGARFFNQTDVTNHSAYCVFEDIYTYRDLEFGWRGNFIYSRWQDCNDGQFGNAVGGQTHCMLYSSNSATGGNQSNMNLLINCQAFYGDFVSGTIYIADGWRWLFINCGFEQFSTYAVYAQGIFNVDFQGCWFEFNSGTNVLGTDVTAAPNAQSTYMIFQSCAFFLGESTTAIVVCKANERISFRDCVLATVPAGTTFTESAGYGDDEQIWFLENNQVLSGTAGSLGLNFNPYAGVAGANVYISADQSTARLALGAGVAGANVYISADQSTARLALGAGVAGANVFIKTTRSDLAAALGTRRIRQIVEDTLSTAFSTTSAAPQDTGLSVTITPLSASSKIAIIASFAAAVNLNKADGADVTSFIYLEKDGTITCTQFRLRATGTPNSVANNLGIGSHPTIEYYDAPGDTDEHTYKLRAFTDGQTTTTVYINEYGGTGTQVARLTAIEYDDP